ncbi:MAG: hypothetical protein WDO69_01255 [Pseudomonadota bacterium]
MIVDSLGRQSFVQSFSGLGELLDCWLVQRGSGLGQSLPFAGSAQTFSDRLSRQRDGSALLVGRL